MENDGMLVSRRWLEKVDDFVNKTEEDSKVQPRGRSAHKTLRTVSLKGTWAKDANGVWKNWGRFVDSRDGAQDDRVAVDVWEPAVTGSTAPPSGRVWVAWRGRWEVVAHPPTQSGSTYQAGDGISIDTTTSPDTIKNTGIRSATFGDPNTSSDVCKIDGGNMQFDPRYFSPMIAGDQHAAYGVRIKAPTLRVGATNNILTIEFLWD